MTNSNQIPPWRDRRLLKILAQIIAISIVIVLCFILATNLVNNFQKLGLSFGFQFLVDPDRPASFRIGDSAIAYRATDPYIRAILVGLLNSLRVTVAGIILATILGITVGISRLSDNWLVRQIATVYVETLRNTPLLLQLFFWYFAVFLKLPKIDNPTVIFKSLFVSNQGIYLPWLAADWQTWLSLGFLAISIPIAIVLEKKQTQNRIKTGKSIPLFSLILISLGVAALLAITLGFNWQFPIYKPDIAKISGGLYLSPEFATLLLGLTVYTAAFIAEVVRAGIQSVNRGQWEAAKALGLAPDLTMRLVIFPQALRVMIPPLTSEFLNLAKNSSLAIAIGYNDIYAIANTISNQTGKAVEMLLVIMATYLSFNLIISSAMNWFNHLVQIRER